MKRVRKVNAEEKVEDKKTTTKKTTTKKKGESKPKYEEVAGKDVEQVVPSTVYIVTLDTEDTKFLVTYRDKDITQCMAMDGTNETITIPTNQFNKGEWTFEYEDKGKLKKATTKVTVHTPNK